jgi:hypothetical protein
MGDIDINGIYAGFFNGNVEVRGILKVNGASVLTSDSRVKNNMQPLSETDESLNKLLKLNPVSYYLNTNPVQLKSSGQSDTINKEIKMDPLLIDRIQRGFIAQELKEVYQDLVFEDDEGILSVNYIGLIPIIVEALKEQQIIISIQEERISKLEKAIASTNNNKTKNLEQSNTVLNQLGSILYQNSPNPFNQSTSIRFYIPESVNIAILYVYDMQGNQIMNFPLSDRGNSNILIQGAELKPGMYLYALIVDGKEVDTKRMILTR